MIQWDQRDQLGGTKISKFCCGLFGSLPGYQLGRDGIGPAVDQPSAGEQNYFANHLTKYICNLLGQTPTIMTKNDDTKNSLFETAMAALYSSEHQARTKDELDKAAARREHTVYDMQEYLRRAGVFLPSTVSIVHITGTKGKGSTACLCESILRHSSLKTGLFTSPHLVDLRERIRIGGRPVSQAIFGQAYWAVREKLEATTATTTNDNDSDGALPTLPGYFRMLFVVAIYIFSHYEPALDVIILEVGMGGRYDATNVFDIDDTRKVACGVTLLDLDHVRVLGNTLEQIAWEKGGIFQLEKGSTENISPKPYSTELLQELPSPVEKARSFYAISTNTPSALQILQSCAATEGQGRRLSVIKENPLYSTIGLPGDHQRINAALAVVLCREICAIDDATVQTALAAASWPGRCQTVSASPNVMLRLDGAHTPKSLEACLEWYTTVANNRRSLVFNCSHERSPVPLLQQLYAVGFEAVYFCPADSERPSGIGKPRAKELLRQEGYKVEGDDDLAMTPTWQETLAEVWTFLDATKTTKITSNVTLRQAVDEIVELKGIHVDVLVAGSLYLVGSALNAVNWKEPDAIGGLQS